MVRISTHPLVLIILHIRTKKLCVRCSFFSYKRLGKARRKQFKKGTDLNPGDIALYYDVNYVYLMHLLSITELNLVIG